MRSHVNLMPVQEKLLASKPRRLSSRRLLRRPLEPTVSFFISVESQEEVDYFWNRLIADGGEESKCGWLKDKFGLSWQVVPKALGRYLSDPDREKPIAPCRP